VVSEEEGKMEEKWRKNEEGREKNWVMWV